MATWTPEGLIVKGAQAAFHETLDKIPQVWDKHCAIYPSDTAVEPHAFPGFIPRPREFVNGRQIQGLRDFTYNIENNEYELSIAIDRKYFEDDQTGLIAERMKEMAEVWGTYKDYLFAALLVAGTTGTAFDGTAFYADTRVIGVSANIDNLTTSVAAADPAVPTAAEFLATLNLSKGFFRGYQDDTGRPFNSLAVTDLRVIAPPIFEAPIFEALNATFIASTENVFKGMADVDVLDYLGSSNAVMYVNALGATRKPFIMQQRTPLEIEIIDSPEALALHNAVLVLCRERFVFAYGDPRRSLVHTYTT